jgi:hypothetical protein
MADGKIVQTSPDVVFSELIDGGILFDLNAKQYYALNASGAYVWKALESGASPEHILALLGKTDGGQAGRDVADFVRVLLSHRLAEQGRAANGGAFAVEAPSAPWVAPTLMPHGNPLAQVIRAPFDPTVPIPE